MDDEQFPYRAAVMYRYEPNFIIQYVRGKPKKIGQGLYANLL